MEARGRGKSNTPEPKISPLAATFRSRIWP
jgi:hypothetical protein